MCFWVTLISNASRKSTNTTRMIDPTIRPTIRRASRNIEISNIPSKKNVASEIAFFYPVFPTQTLLELQSPFEESVLGIRANKMFLHRSAVMA